MRTIRLIAPPRQPPEVKSNTHLIVSDPCVPSVLCGVSSIVSLSEAVSPTYKGVCCLQPLISGWYQMELLKSFNT